MPLTPTSSQENGAKPPPGTGGGLAPEAPARSRVSKEDKGPGRRQAPALACQGSIQTRGCIERGAGGDRFFDSKNLRLG